MVTPPSVFCLDWPGRRRAFCVQDSVEADDDEAFGAISKGAAGQAISNEA
jgi:hypothetical protein